MTAAQLIFDIMSNTYPDAEMGVKIHRKDNDADFHLSVPPGRNYFIKTRRYKGKTTRENISPAKKFKPKAASLLIVAWLANAQVDQEAVE